MDGKDFRRKTRVDITGKLIWVVKLILALSVGILVFVCSIQIAMSVDRSRREDNMHEVGYSYSPPELDGFGGGVIGFLR